MMRLAERQAEPRAPASRRGRSRSRSPRPPRARSASTLAVMSRTMPVHRGERQHQAVGGVEDLLLVLLHVLGIGERQALHHRQSARPSAPDDPPDLGPDQLRRVGVLLLRHDRGAGGEPVRQPHEAELRRGPDHQLLGEARQVRGADATRPRGTRARSRGRDTASSEFAIGRSKPSAAAVMCRSIGKPVPASAAAPERAFVHPRARVAEPARGRGPASRHRPACGGPRSPAARPGDA